MPGRPEHPDATHQVTSDAIAAKLRSGGGRITATRRATIEVLLKAGEHRHLSAEDVVVEVRDRLPDVAESTVYRTLAALEDLGVVHHVHLGHGPSTYHLAEVRHRHLVCQRCDTVIEVSPDDFAAFSARLQELYGFSMSDEHFALAGLCRTCGGRHVTSPPVDGGASTPAGLG